MFCWWVFVACLFDVYCLLSVDCSLFCVLCCVVCVRLLFVVRRLTFDVCWSRFVGLCLVCVVCCVMVDCCRLLVGRCLLRVVCVSLLVVVVRCRWLGWLFGVVCLAFRVVGCQLFDVAWCRRCELLVVG